MIGKRIATLLASNGRTPSELARFCGVSAQAAHQWVNGVTEPRGSKKDLIAEFFGITRQELEYKPVLSLAPLVRGRTMLDSPVSEAMCRQMADLFVIAELTNSPRSIEYTQGMRDKIIGLLCGVPTTSDYKNGTCQADAYEAGQLRGEQLISTIKPERR